MGYREFKDIQQKEVNELPIVFAFSNKQFEEAMTKLGLTVKDTDKIYGLSGGGFYRKSDHDLIRNTFIRHQKEFDEIISNDTNGEFMFNMFNYELANHEFIVTHETEDTLEALGITQEELQRNEIMKDALNRAIKNQYENRIVR